ncbi:MAG: 16S rRNA (guanine(966)-N(2))-methyltransferase RsmD [Actinobacteria bacterium]|nr:16S rRNA (guanine(966)-N(2))-methyltransferase RsmD [Actinomycetota bacterium]
MRVVSGTAGGLRLDAPPGDTTRPTSDRVREATFNALDSLGAVEGALVLDAFAGSGALGIEALSRGAAHATFVESDPVARGVVEANLRATTLADRATVTGGDGLRQAASGPFDLVLLDPPYDTDRWDELLAAAAEGLAPGGVVVVESDREIAAPAALDAVRVRRYGSTVVTFLSTPGAPL